MSEKVRSIRRNGEMKRATWDPSNIVGLSGWPLRNYLWWREKKGYDGPENFCHFMRVALFWAPLRWIGTWADRIIFNKWFIMTLCGVWFLFLVLSGNTIILLAIAVGLIVAMILSEVIPRMAPTISRGGKWFFTAHSSSAPWLRPWVVAVAAVVALAPFSELALAATQGLVTGLLIVGLFVVVSWLADRQVAARKLAEQRELERQREVYLRILFDITHPKWEGNEERFVAWLARYKAWFNSASRDLEKMDPDDIASWAPWRAEHSHYAALERYEAGLPRRKPAKPKKARRRIIPVGVVTFFQLVWAFVVTTKWKTCPIISIPAVQKS